MSTRSTVANGEMIAADPPTTSRASRSSLSPFGIKPADIAKFLISMVAAVVVVYFGMKTAIEHNTASIRSNTDGVAESDRALKSSDDKLSKHVDHETAVAKELDKRIGTVERTTDRIEVKQEQTLDAIRELRTDIRDARRRYSHR